MADAAPAGDRGGFRGGFGDRGRQVFQSPDNSQHIKVRRILNNCYVLGVAAAVAIEAGAVETVVVDVEGARRRRWDKNIFKLRMLPCDDYLVLLEAS